MVLWGQIHSFPPIPTDSIIRCLIWRVWKYVCVRERTIERAWMPRHVRVREYLKYFDNPYIVGPELFIIDCWYSLSYIANSRKRVFHTETFQACENRLINRNINEENQRLSVLSENNSRGPFDEYSTQAGCYNIQCRIWVQSYWGIYSVFGWSWLDDKHI